MKYTYDSRTDTYVFSAADLFEHNRRLTTPKEKIEAEDAAENERRRRRARR